MLKLRGPRAKTQAIRKQNGKPVMDYRLLEPGWAGEIAPDELEFLQEELARDKAVAFAWGFQPAKKSSTELFETQTYHISCQTL